MNTDQILFNYMEAVGTGRGVTMAELLAFCTNIYKIAREIDPEIYIYFEADNGSFSLELDRYSDVFAKFGDRIYLIRELSKNEMFNEKRGMDNVLRTAVEKALETVKKGETDVEKSKNK